MWPSTAGKFVSDRPIGTGPFRFVEYVVGERVVLEASPDYWGAKAASQRLVWQIVPDPATRVAALARGTIDVMLNLPVPLITVEGDAKLAVYSELGSSVHLLLLNVLQAPPAQDRRVRQALAYAIDRATIVKSLYAGRGEARQFRRRPAGDERDRPTRLRLRSGSRQRAFCLRSRASNT